jgi:hypothetical protein
MTSRCCPNELLQGTQEVSTFDDSEWVGLARTIYMRCIYCIFGRDITKYMVMYGVCIQFWPILYNGAWCECVV